MSYLVMTPKADDEVLSRDVILGLMSQTLDIEWLVVSRQRDAQRRQWSRCETRNVLNRFSRDSEYVFLLDSNVVLDKPDVLEKMRDCVEPNGGDAIVIHTREHYVGGAHKRISLALVRGAILKDVAFGGSSCECGQLAKKCRIDVMGYPDSCHEIQAKRVVRS